MEEWKEVSKSRPCSVCEKTNWCKYLEDNSASICRRTELSHQGIIKTDKNGSTFRLVTDRSKSKRLDQLMKKVTPHKVFKPTDNSLQKELDDIEKSVIYSEMLTSLTLILKDKKSLINKRGIQRDEIKTRGYRSYNDKNDYSKIISLLGLFEESDLLQIPGFYLKNRKLHFYSPDGLWIPVRNQYGFIIAIKIRTKFESCKYLYLSSKNKGGTSPGSPLHFPLHDEQDYKSIILTEGELKADIITIKLKKLCISIPGVQSWKKFIAAAQLLKCEEILIAMDKDADSNPDVARSLVNLYTNLCELNINARIITW